MSIKVKNPETVIRNLLTAAFFRYHLNKMGLAEFVIRFLRIDLISRGESKETLELLKVVRNYQRNIKDCECPPVVPPEKKKVKVLFDKMKDLI